MPSNNASWDRDWSVGLHVWVERAGRAILGEGRLELLEGIHTRQSISAAARQMGMSYRKAWLLVQEVNAAAGLAFVETATGGHHGGGARLTAQGLQAVALFRELRQQLRLSAAAVLARLVQGPEPATVHIAAAVSLEEVLGQLAADYALRRPALRVRMVVGASDELADLLLAGAPADLLLSADAHQLERLQAAGLVQPGTPAVLAENSLAVVGLAGQFTPLRTPEELAHVPRIALAGAASPLGRYTRLYLDSHGLYESLLPRVVFVDSARAVVSAVRAGRASVGLAYGSDAGHAEGCQVLLRARRLPSPIRYTGAVVTSGRQPDEARLLLDFLTSAHAAARFRSCGFLRQARHPRH